MIGREAHITFHQETWHQACLVFMLLALKKGHHKSLFNTLRYLSKNFTHYFIRLTTMKRFRIATYSHAASFLIKTNFYEINNLFYSKIKQTLTVHKSTFEIKAMLA